MFLRYGPADDHVQLSEAEIDEEFGKQDIARVFIKRGDLTEADVERGVTEMWIVETTGMSDADADFGGILRDISQNGSLTEFIVESFERYARDGTPTPGGERWTGVADSAIISDGVSEVSQLLVGTIDTVRSPMTMIFSHTSQAKKIRETEVAGGGELKYRPDKTVDYVAELGSDRTGTTLSPANQNLVGEFNAERKGGDADVTHLRIVGAGEGRAQQTVNFVPQDDPYDYENDDDFSNVNRYTAGHWSQGDRKEWDVRSNKDHTEINSLERLGETIVNDIQDAHIEATANIRGLDVDLGDEFTVNYPEEDIDQTARVVKMTTKIDATGFVYQATLSSRQQALEDPDSNERKDTDRYNLAFEGSPVTLNTSGGRQPVNATVNYQFSFYYPAEVKYEHRVQMFIRGDAYRAYSSGALSGGDHTHTFEYITTGAHGHSITSTEFNHSHTLDPTNASTQFHGHGDGTYGAASHPHTDGTFGADSHPHADGTFGAVSHPHADGTFGAASHPHDSGTYDADTHDHTFNSVESSDADADHGRVAGQDTEANLDFVGDTNNSWREVATISESNYEFMVVHVHATSASNVLFARARDSSRVGSNDSSPDQYFTPAPGGAAVVGSASGHDHGNNNNSSDGDGYSASISLFVPADWGFVDVDVRTPSGAANANIQVGFISIDNHSHSVPVSGDTGFTGPPVLGDSGNTSPDVSGRSGDTAPDVSGQSGSTAPDVDGESGNAAPDVGGSSGSTSTGVDGDSESTGGVRTTTTETETTTTTSTPPDQGGHEHDPEPGLVEFSSELPSNCDVLVNGVSVGTSFGDGTSIFQEQVDLEGFLQPGQINTIEVTSDTLGHIQAHIDIDVYRQILGNG